jgi:histidyl-tRNA synthetase
MLCSPKAFSQGQTVILRIDALQFHLLEMDEKTLTTLPGTRDILPDEISRWHLIEDQARRIFALYGFEEIRTPLFEATELFARGIGGETDIVQKEMYTFEDQSGRSITLRPEATASVVRAYNEHHMGRGSGLTRLYYVGPMFRYEKKQKGRWRQFYQIGAEVLGSDHPAIEAEVIEMILALLEPLGIESRLQINSVGCRDCRPRYVEALREALVKDLSPFCEDCRRRAETNTLRVLDCKVESCQPYINRLPKITDYLCEQCSEHFARFKGYLDEARIAYEVAPRLVRGLDYYVRTAFEIISGDLGAQNAIVGGGRYDGLSEILGGPPAHGFGFALGLDRLIMIVPDGVIRNSASRPDLFLVPLGEAALRRASALARALRQEGVRCQLEFDGGSLRSQMRLANKLGASHVLIVGDTELTSDRYTIKSMEDSRQWDASLPELVQYFKSL